MEIVHSGMNISSPISHEIMLPSTPDKHVSATPSNSLVSFANVFGPHFWKPVGLMNLGNTCYLNCVVQCLLVSNYYSNYLSMSSGSALTSTLAHLLLDLYHSNQCIYELKSVLSSGDALFQGSFQQDAHEALLKLLNLLELDTRTNLFQSLPLTPVFTSIIKDTFYGTLKHSYTCSECDNVIMHTEDLNYITVQPGGSIEGELLHLFAPRQSEIMCQVCGLETHHITHTGIWHQPQISIVLVNRFRQNGNTVQKDQAVTVCNPEISSTDFFWKTYWIY